MKIATDPRRSPDTRLWLDENVYWCRLKDDIVFSDMRRDRYFRVNAMGFDRVAKHRITQWDPDVIAEPTTENGTAEQEANMFFDFMIEKRMLTNRKKGGKSGLATKHTVATEDLLDGYFHEHLPVTAFDVLLTLFSYMHSRIALWTLAGRLPGATNRLRGQSPPDDTRALDERTRDYAREQVRKFIRISGWLFGRKDRCLLSSLALRRFLRYRNLFPRVVIGVSGSMGFSAHCWLQHAGIVFNDSYMRVSRFTPIMAF